MQMPAITRKQTQSNKQKEKKQKKNTNPLKPKLNILSCFKHILL